MYIGLQPAAKHQLGLFVRLQPLEHQPCLVQATTLDLGAPTPRTPILPVLRHQPQGLQPSAVNCLDIFGSNSLLPTLLDLRLTSVLLLLPRLPDLQLPLFLTVHTCKLSLFSIIDARYALTFGFLFARLIFGFLCARSTFWLLYLRLLDLRFPLSLQFHQYSTDTFIWKRGRLMMSHIKIISERPFHPQT